MENIFEKIIDIIIAIIIFFIFPIIYFGQHQDTITQQIVAMKSTAFTDTVRTQGYITKNMYEAYLSQLDATNVIYDIDLEHRVLALEPEYRFRTEEEIKDEQDDSYTGDNFYTFIPVTTEIPSVNDPVNNGNLNTETNESVLETAIDTPALPGHVHTDSCYKGTKHLHTGNSSSGGGCYSRYVAGSSCNSSSWTDTGYSGTCYSTGTCNVCHGETQIITIQHSARCSSGHITMYTYQGFYSCPSCGWHREDTYGVPTYTCGASNPGYYVLSCGKTEGVYYDSNGNICTPVCSQLVVDITPTHPIQTVAVNDPLITTVIVKHLDGSTTTKVCTTTFSSAGVGVNQSATLTYSYTVAGISYSKSCSITVTVIPRSKTCQNGHTYNLKEDGSDPGCPYCRAWLRSLAITTPPSGMITIFKGTTLPENGVTLLATYMDDREEYLHNEYVDNLDTQYVGTQTVTISYKGKYVSLIVITKRNLIRCSVCGHYYELYPDGTDPGCPYCASRTPVFTGYVMKYYSSSYASEIVKELYEGSGIYYFNRGDYFSIAVSNKKKTFGKKILDFVLHGVPDVTIHYEDGGNIRDAAYD